MSRLEELCFRVHRMDLEEDFYPYGDGGELRAALRRKEEELVLAAQLGNALLNENRQLKEEKNKLQEQNTEKIEELEQDRHNLRLKLQGCQAQWESQVGELERDVRVLNARAERLTRQLKEAEKEKSRSEEQHNQISQQLQEQLQAAMEVKLAVTAELQSLKQELGEKSHPRLQDEEMLSVLKEQVARLTEREQSLEQRLETVCKENAGLRDSVSSLYTQLALQEQQINTQTQQLAEAWQEVELRKDKVQDLQSQIEELQEEVSLQRTADGNTSLLSEMERSLEAVNWSPDKEQVIQEVSSILHMLLPVSRGSEAQCNQDDRLQSMLGQLKSAAERIVHNETLQEMNRPIVGGDTAPCENTSWIQELRDQNTQLLNENAELRLKADSRLDKEIIQRAIKDRDDAISKKTAVEAELVRCRNDMMYLNNQLLEAIQRKLELSQELEAWQDDIQVIINQQLKSQTEQQMQSKRSGGSRLSFFRKPLKASSSVSCIPEATAVPNRSPWKNWLNVAK
ncbi:BICD family-like cargo adapter 1 isoform X1 [Tachysurus fulvidraco]|uniref:BICD family-like cargo adapter 1 isoform X1 n=1 Tax=Tachysurus fulvidraco TaxID=1234273 RepID=UPI001FF0140A|nr:BICD family-like cargo adapter 1 isoform X1 [Tachysurus fulvidraco]